MERRENLGSKDATDQSTQLRCDNQIRETLVFLVNKVMNENLKYRNLVMHSEYFVNEFIFICEKFHYSYNVAIFNQFKMHK
jgi:hypothetical protein